MMRGDDAAVGPYLSERAWAIVREDYGPDGTSGKQLCTGR
jgi:hypothetical protein